MSWHRGTEAPMDTSPAGPRKRSIFDAQSDAPAAFAPSSILASPAPTPPPPPFHSGAPFLFHCKPGLQVHDTLADVEMASVTPPSNRTVDRTDPNAAWVDDHQDYTTAGDAAAHDASPSKRSERPISSAAVHRVRRKRSVHARSSSRRRNGQMVLAHRSARGLDDDEDDQDRDDEDEDDDDDDEEGRTPNRMRSITKYAVNYFMPSGFDGGVPMAGRAKDGGVVVSGVDHRDWPELLLGYAQFVFNASILAAFLYLLFCVVRTVQQDVAEKVRGYEMDTLSEVTSCAASYTANRCGTDLQAPALAAACLNWERCSARDPAVVGRARVTAETFAEILNGFVDVVSWKSMVFSLVSLSIVVGATNSTLSFFRFRSRRHHLEQVQGAVPPPSSSASVGHPQHQQQQQHHMAYMGHPAMYHPGAGLTAPWSIASPPATPARKRIHRSHTANVGDE
ncbi:hypothetical protein ACQY0O_006480 [Thecaphora frezii]